MLKVQRKSKKSPKKRPKTASDNQKSLWHIGIDEAGRGPLAGPVSVGAILVRHDFDFSIFKNLKDSKKLSEARREEFFTLINHLSSQKQKNHEPNWIRFAVVLVSHKIIDKKGISFAIRSGIDSILKKLSPNIKQTKIFLDGSLKAPAIFTQETIIKGDEKIPVISLASITAKVTRDRHMNKISKKYPVFDFHIHKGYGTQAHIEAIKKHGASDIHRQSFISRIVQI